MSLTINETFYDLKDGKKGKLAVFIYYGLEDPRVHLDTAISQYVGDGDCYELIVASLDNPWVRVIISDIDKINQEVFDIKKHKLYDIGV
jgi:hypothetical protein